jgi:ABC-type multidrug transport system fused ATPase/permease subunit
VWLRDPDLVVLDEATARVDPETERRIAEAIGELMKGRTTFVIAHRLSTLDMVDEVIVFDHGRVTEHGERAALVGDKASRFRRLLELALAVEADGGGLDSVTTEDELAAVGEDPTLHRVEADV